MIELEKKKLLADEEYDYLMVHLGSADPLFPKPILKQTNYYFDTDDLAMNRQNTTCRIRLKNGKYKATMKIHSENEDQSLEIKMEVRNGIEDNAFTEMGLKLQGELTTYRCVILKDEHCEVTLDKNEYLGTVDSELEIEYLPEYEKEAQTIYRVILDMLTRRKNFLAYMQSYEQQPSTPSKSKRFFQLKERDYENKSLAGRQVNRQSHDNTNEPISKLDTGYLNDDVSMYGYSDPDDYLRDYYGSVMQ